MNPLQAFFKGRIGRQAGQTLFMTPGIPEFPECAGQFFQASQRAAVFFAAQRGGELGGITRAADAFTGRVQRLHVLFKARYLDCTNPAKLFFQPFFEIGVCVR